jgi:hypothetical protein
MMTALNIGRTRQKGSDFENRVPSSYTSSNFVENTIEQIAKGQRVMHALQKMYERKLIKQIK